MTARTLRFNLKNHDGIITPNLIPCVFYRQAQIATSRACFATMIAGCLSCPPASDQRLGDSQERL